MGYDWKTAKAIEKKNRVRLMALNPNLDDNSGIYVFYREDENGFKHAYVGQAKHTLQRLCQHLVGYTQHIDKSIRKHGLWDLSKNPFGWTVRYIPCSEQDLNVMERYYIKAYADTGCQLKNVTLGGQDQGKENINANAPSRGYFDGVEQGKKKMRQLVKVYFDKYLDVAIKGETNKIKERKLQEFLALIGEENE